MVFAICELQLEDLIKIDGFAKKTAKQIVDGLFSIKDQFSNIFALGFNLELTPHVSNSQNISSPITGKTIVFTGSMQNSIRSDMVKKAKLLGAKITKSVSGNIDYLGGCCKKSEQVSESYN